MNNSINFEVFTISGEKAYDIKLELRDEMKVEFDSSFIKNVFYMLRIRKGAEQKFAHAKNRSEVAGSTRKIYKQKGTGGARHGSRKASLFRGGGKAHGPEAESRSVSIPKKVIFLAKRMIIGYVVKSNKIIVVKDINLETHKTKQIAGFV